MIPSINQPVGYFSDPSAAQPGGTLVQESDELLSVVDGGFSDVDGDDFSSVWPGFLDSAAGDPEFLFA